MPEPVATDWACCSYNRRLWRRTEDGHGRYVASGTDRADRRQVVVGSRPDHVVALAAHHEFGLLAREARTSGMLGRARHCPA